MSPYVVSMTIHGEHGSLWYLSQLVPLTNLLSICLYWQMPLRLVFLLKNPLRLVFGLNKPFGINF